MRIAVRDKDVELGGLLIQDMETCLERFICDGIGDPILRAQESSSKLRKQQI